MSPSSGPVGGSTVTVVGTGFASGATVMFSGSPGNVTSVTPTAITVDTPPHAAGTVDVVVRNPNGQAGTLSAGFTFVGPPIVASISPASATQAGGPVTISGADFQQGATVTLGGATLAPTSVTSTSLSLTAPPQAAGVVDVVVTNPDGQSGTLPERSPICPARNSSP